MAKFRCKQSGSIVEFHNEYDIETTSMQEDYEKVVEVKEEQRPPVKTTRTKPKGNK